MHPLLFYILVGLIGPTFLCFSVFNWLKTGTWLPVENQLFLDGEFGAWLANPRSWFGFHKIASFVMKYVPLGLVSLPIAFCLMSSWAEGQEKRKRETKTVRPPVEPAARE